MDGLDRLKEEILRDAKERAAAILRNADEYAERSAEETEEKIRSLNEEIATELTRDLEALRRRYTSLSDNERRKAQLAQRRALLEEVPRLALEKLNQASVEEKVKRYATWIQNAAWEGGEVSLAEAEQDVLAPLLEQLGAKFTAGPAAPITGGLLLRRGETVENLSYDLYLRRNNAEISSFLAKRLFTEEE